MLQPRGRVRGRVAAQIEVLADRFIEPILVMYWPICQYMTFAAKPPLFEIPIKTIY